MLGLASETVVVQGKTYNLKPYSAFNLERLNNAGAMISKELTEGKITEFEYYDKLLQLVIEDRGEWDVTAKDFNAREAENAVLSFVPPSKQAYLLLTGFQPV